MGRVVLVSSQKKDIGKTILAIKTGIELSKMGKTVLLIDLSFGKKKISEYLNVCEDIIYDIKDVLDLTCSLEQAVMDINGTLSLLPNPRVTDKLGNIKVEEFSKLINQAKDKYDVIIVDVDKISLSYIDFKCIEFIININNNDFSCIKELNIDKSIINKYEGNDAIVIINKFSKKSAVRGTMLKLEDIKRMTNIQNLIVIEENVSYSGANYDFLINNQDNSFNKAIKGITLKLN
ncbi:MAG: division plane positioning ATPase MipZ [Sedimentibacter sp.]